MKTAVFSWPVRVYYEDTDAGGVVYYANYLRFLERARTEWLRSLGFEQAKLLRDFGVIFVVKRVAIEYLQPARFDDALTVTVQLSSMKHASLDLSQSVLREVPLIEAQVVIACVDPTRFKPARLPAALQQRLEMSP